MPKVIRGVRAIREEKPKPTGPREDLRGEGWDWKFLEGDRDTLDLNPDALLACWV